MTDKNSAIQTANLQNSQVTEYLTVNGAITQQTELEEQIAELVDKTTGYSLIVTDSVTSFKSFLTSYVSTLNTFSEDSTNSDTIRYIAEKNNSEVPYWLYGLVGIQYGYEPTTVSDLTLSGAAALTTFLGDPKETTFNYNKGGQFPTASEVLAGHNDITTVSVMVQKAIASTTQSTALGVSYETLHDRAYQSSLGVWAIHLPFNGISTEITKGGGLVTKITSQAQYCNDPQLRFGKFSSDADPQGYSSYRGYGWSSANTPGWSTSTEAEDIIKEYYEDSVLDATGLSLILADRLSDTTTTYSVDVSAVSITASGEQIEFTVSFDDVALIGRDISSDVTGSIAFACANTSLDSGRYDTIYGFTSFVTWRTYEKDTDGTWLSFDTSSMSGQDWIRKTDLDGTGLFINAFSVHDITQESGGFQEGRDLFYQLHDTESRLNFDVVKAHYLQGVYSGIVRELASTTGGWTNQYTSLISALDIATEKTQTFINEETPEGILVKPIEGYLSLLGSEISGIQCSTPVDTFDNGFVLGGIGCTVLTGEMYNATKD